MEIIINLVYKFYYFLYNVRNFYYVFLLDFFSYFLVRGKELFMIICSIYLNYLENKC